MDSYKCYDKKGEKFEKIDSLARLLKILSVENRLEILCILKKNEHCVCEVMECVDISQSLISHHFKDLREAGLVVSEKRGRRVYYSLTDFGEKVVNLLFQIKKL